MLNPDDVVNYPLKQAVRGYSVPQVDELLDQVADTIDQLRRDLRNREQRLRECSERLAATSETEATLKRTLVTAQRAAEQSLEEARERSTSIVDDAQREADAILEQAREDAEELREQTLRDARAEEEQTRQRLAALEQQVERLQAFERDFRARLRTELESHLARLAETAAGTTPAPSVGAEEDLAAESDAASVPVARRPAAPARSAPDALVDVWRPSNRNLTVRVHPDATEAGADPDVDEPLDDSTAEQAGDEVGDGEQSVAGAGDERTNASLASAPNAASPQTDRDDEPS